MMDRRGTGSTGSAPLTLGRYELLFRFAAGGMAEVYAARARGAEGFQRLVAVKRMLPTLSDDPKFVEMFLDEANVAASVHSRHVVSTLDLGRASDGSLYIVMDLIRGLSLNRLVKAARRAGEELPVPIVSEILAQTARGLHDAHEAVTPEGKHLEIVHRDVSPQNVLLDRAGGVRLTDFGVARAVERVSRGTATGELRGKVAYFAPEQMTNGTIDRRTDVFALGVVAHELLTGRRLFRAENAWLTLQQVATAEIPRVDALREAVPEALADAVEKALCRDAAGRFETAADFGDAIREAAPPAGAEALGALVARLGEDYLEVLETKLRHAARTAAIPAEEGASRDRPAAAAPGTQDGAPTVASPAPASITAELPEVAVAEVGAPDVTTSGASEVFRRPGLWWLIVPGLVAAAAAFAALRLGAAEDAPPPGRDEPTQRRSAAGAEGAAAPEPPGLEIAPDEPAPDEPAPDEPAPAGDETARDEARRTEPATDPRERDRPAAGAPEGDSEARAAREGPARRGRPRRPDPRPPAPTPEPSAAATRSAPAAPSEAPRGAGSSVLMGSDAFERELEER